ncbi:hypothetical protein BJ742DRAFT_901595 [Cladochytrium replicatum]|nr:hypothetical protein BJ742DRAFT_901595 [Cladochytrium replicatum]
MPKFPYGKLLLLCVITCTNAQSLSLQQRQQAANQAATSSTECRAIQPFYYELGNSNSALTSGSIGSGAHQYTADSQIKIASASKWLFGSYVVQLKRGNVTPAEIDALTMRSGYTNFAYGSCAGLPAATATVSQCFETRNLANGGFNNGFNASDVGKYYYQGGHFQHLAIDDFKMGPLTAAGLGANVTAVLNSNITGSDAFSLTYDSAQLSGGALATPSAYAKFLRAILQRRLLISQYLSAQEVCTNPLFCPDTAKYTPIPLTASWFYGLGFWIEPKASMAKDLTGGVAYYSCGGGLGFYPWIDSSLTSYGMIAREDFIGVLKSDDGVGYDSMLCGALVRNAWLSGNAAPTPTNSSTTPTSNALHLTRRKTYAALWISSIITALMLAR